MQGIMKPCCLCAGLNPLVPYMSKMLAEQVKRSLKSVKRLSLLLKVCLFLSVCFRP